MRRKLADTKGSSALALGSSVTVANFRRALDRQYVSTRMASGINFFSPTIDCYLQALESNADDNIDSMATAVQIVSEDGATVRDTTTLLTRGAPSPSFEYPTTATSLGWRVAYSSGLNYTTVTGDRLVIEIGHYNGTGGTTPSAQVRWGENGTDLAASEGDTATTKNGWIEFSTNITFIGEAGDTTPPTVTSAFTNPSGTTLNITTSEAVSFGAGGSSGFVLTASGGASSATYSSGSGSASLVYTLGRGIASGESLTLAYTQPGNGWEDAAGNDLANFSGTAVTNNVAPARLFYRRGRRR